MGVGILLLLELEIVVGRVDADGGAPAAVSWWGGGVGVAGWGGIGSVSGIVRTELGAVGLRNCVRDRDRDRVPSRDRGRRRRGPCRGKGAGGGLGGDLCVGRGYGCEGAGRWVGW